MTDEGFRQKMQCIAQGRPNTYVLVSIGNLFYCIKDDQDNNLSSRDPYEFSNLTDALKQANEQHLDSDDLKTNEKSINILCLIEYDSDNIIGEL